MRASVGGFKPVHLSFPVVIGIGTFDSDVNFAHFGTLKGLKDTLKVCSITELVIEQTFEALLGTHLGLLLEPKWLTLCHKHQGMCPKACR